MRKLAKIADVVVEGLFDTGSQITAIRDNFYQLMVPSLQEETIQLQGFGGASPTPFVRIL